MTFPSLISLVMVQILTSSRGRALQALEGSGSPRGSEEDVCAGAVPSMALALLDVHVGGSHLVAHGLQGSLEKTRILPVIEGRQQ